MANMGNIPIKQDPLFKKYTEKQGFPNQTNRTDIYFSRCREASKRFQNSKTASFKVSLQKG